MSRLVDSLSVERLYTQMVGRGYARCEGGDGSVRFQKLLRDVGGNK